jgi:hypothetical protein
MSEGTAMDKVRGNFWGNQIEDVMSEIARQATLCRVKLLDPGVIEGVLENNPAVWDGTNERAYKKMREMLMLGFVVKEKSVDKLGPLETEALVTEIRTRLKDRLGGKLGGTPG